MNHHDLIARRRRQEVIEPKLLSHKDIDRHMAEFLARRGRIKTPEYVELRCVTPTNKTGNATERRWTREALDYVAGSTPHSAKWVEKRRKQSAARNRGAA